MLCLSLDAGNLQEASGVVVPLLTVNKNASDDEAEIQSTFTHDAAAVTQTTAADRRSAADEPVLIPDNLPIQSSLDQNDTIFQLSTNDSQQLPLSYPATAASAIDSLETGYSAFSMNTTTAANDFTDVVATRESFVEEEAGRKNGESASGNLCLSSFVAAKCKKTTM